jgi:hypothetical protein
MHNPYTTRVRPLYLAICMAVGLVLTTSCGCSNGPTIAGAKAGWAVIGPEYRAYIQADPALDADGKATKLRTADILTKLLDEGAGK